MHNKTFNHYRHYVLTLFAAMKIAIALCLVACLVASVSCQGMSALAGRGAAAGGSSSQAQQMAMLAALARQGGGQGLMGSPMGMMMLMRSKCKSIIDYRMFCY